MTGPDADTMAAFVADALSMAARATVAAEGDAGSGGRARLMREAQARAHLSHPNVVTVFDVGAHGGPLFVAMELVEGGSLSAWLQRAPRGTEEIPKRMIEAGRGLAAAHAWPTPAPTSGHSARRSTKRSPATQASE